MLTNPLHVEIYVEMLGGGYSATFHYLIDCMKRMLLSSHDPRFVPSQKLRRAMGGVLSVTGSTGSTVSATAMTWPTTGASNSYECCLDPDVEGTVQDLPSFRTRWQAHAQAAWLPAYPKPLSSKFVSRNAPSGKLWPCTAGTPREGHSEMLIPANGTVQFL